MLLEIEKLTVGYGGAPAIWDIALEVDEREIVYAVDRHIGGLYTLEMDF